MDQLGNISHHSQPIRCRYPFTENHISIRVSREVPPAKGQYPLRSLQLLEDVELIGSQDITNHDLVVRGKRSEGKVDVRVF